MIHSSVQVAAPGVQVTPGITTASVAIPFDSGGTRLARFVRFQATGYAYVRPGAAAVTATVNDILLSGSEDLILNVSGCTHIAYLQETAAAKINITPVES